MYNVIEFTMTVQGHPGSSISQPIESASSVAITLVLSCTVSEIRLLKRQKWPIVPTAVSFNALLRVTLFEFPDEPELGKTRVFGLSGEEIVTKAG